MSMKKRLTGQLERSVIEFRRNRAREDLLSKGDRFLDDNGFSRDLLELGNAAWPWRAPESGNAALANVAAAVRRATPTNRLAVATSSRTNELAIAELGALSDAELADLDIARGNIADAVRNGRPQDYPADRQAA